MDDPLIGSLISERYRLTNVVGKGGMGIVYRAEDNRLSGRPCAVKLISGSSADPDEAERFEREVRIIARLRSPNIVQVLDTGLLDDGRRYIVMELLEGIPLSTLFKRAGALGPQRAVVLIKGIMAALAEAHEHGVVHRDLKPANVMVCRTRTGEEVAKVLDFGIAKEVTGARDMDLTAASMLIGTPKYMAPEQFLKHPPDARTDLYAAGLLFYQMLAGAPPFLPEHPVPDTVANMPAEFRVGWLHINQPPAVLDVVPELWAVLAGLLAKKPDGRYPSAEHVLAALQPHLTGPVVASYGEFPQMDPSPSQNSQTTGFPIVGEALQGEQGGPRWPMALAALLLVAMGGAGALIYQQQQRQAAEDAKPTRRPPKAVKLSPAKTTCTDQIKTTPPGATVRKGPEQKLGVTPFSVERPCKEPWRITIERAGYATRELVLKGTEPSNAVFVPLARQVQKTTPPPVELVKPAAPKKVAPRRPARPAPRARQPIKSRARVRPAPARRPAPKKAPAKKPPAKKPGASPLPF